MVTLLDWNEKVIFDKNKQIDSINYSFFKGVDGIIDFKWFLMPENKEDSKNAKLLIKPENKAIKYPKSISLNKELNLLELKLDARKLPDSWSGELMIESNGFVKKIPINFEKLKSSH